jgi:hypothetical protein
MADDARADAWPRSIGRSADDATGDIFPWSPPGTWGLQEVCLATVEGKCLHGNYGLIGRRRGFADVGEANHVAWVAGRYEDLHYA